MPVPLSMVKNRYYLGIDPGVSGGVALLSWNPGDGRPPTALFTQSIPATRKDLWDVVSSMSAYKPYAVIEKVGGYIGEKQPGSIMFKFGASYGELCMALTAASITYEEVQPRKWQKGLSIPGRKRDETKTVWKNRLKGLAQQLFPSTKITLAVSDALLMAEFCRRSREEK